MQILLCNFVCERKSIHKLCKNDITCNTLKYSFLKNSLQHLSFSLSFFPMSMCHKLETKAIERTESCEWKISESILRGIKPGKFVKTPFFDIPGSQYGKWAVEIYPNGFNSSSRGYFSIYLHCKTKVELFSNISFKIGYSKYEVSAAASKVDAGYDVSALSTSVDFINVMTYDFHGTWESQTGQNSPLFSAPGDTTNFNTVKSRHTFTDFNSYYGFLKFLKRSDVFNPRCRHLKLKELTLICEFKYSVLRKPNASIIAEIPKLQNTVLKLDQCLMKNGDDLTDCTLIVEEKEIKVHKLILYIRSPVFQRMFESSMKEGIEGRAFITDFSHKIVSKAIEFCYSGEINNYQKDCFELLKFSDKYDISALKIYLEQYLMGKITVENVCEYLAVADLTNSLNLRQCCIKFISSNLDFITSFNGFSQLDSEIIKEVFTYKK